MHSSRTVHASNIGTLGPFGLGKAALMQVGHLPAHLHLGLLISIFISSAPRLRHLGKSDAPGHGANRWGFIGRTESENLLFLLVLVLLGGAHALREHGRFHGRCGVSGGSAS